MNVGRFRNPFLAYRALNFHNAGLTPLNAFGKPSVRWHWVEHHPESPEPYWILNAIPWPRGMETVAQPAPTGTGSGASEGGEAGRGHLADGEPRAGGADSGSAL